MKNFQKTWILAMLCSVFSLHLNAYAQQISDGFIIKGIITGAKDGTLIKLYDFDKAITIDSAIVNNSSFVLTGQVTEPTGVWLMCGDEYAILRLENVPMSFKASLKDMKLNSVTHGGKEQDLQNDLDKLLRPYERIYSPLYDSLQNKLHKDTLHRKRMVKEFNTALDTYQNLYVDFGKQHVNSYLGLDIIYKNRQSIPKDSIMILLSELKGPLKGKDQAKSLKIYATEVLAQKGKKYLDFSATGLNGEPFKLSSLKDKFIYLTFGSFACGPCRVENKEISNNYNILSKTMHIVNFSLDVNREEWERAAKQDKITWFNVSDMDGMSSKIKTLYDVQLMPTSFLIDKNGIIIERFNGYHADNLKKISKIIQEN